MNIDTDQEDFLDISEDNADEMQMDSSQASKGSSNFGNKTDCEDELNSKAMRGKATDWITEVEFTSQVSRESSTAGLGGQLQHALQEDQQGWRHHKSVSV